MEASAPEKIWIDPTSDLSKLSGHVDKDSVEYIRKDAFLDTLDMKEVDLEKELNKEWNKCEPIDEGMGLEIASIEHEQFDNIAKHFFELGMQVSNKAQKGE